MLVLSTHAAYSALPEKRPVWPLQGCGQECLLRAPQPGDSGPGDLGPGDSGSGDSSSLYCHSWPCCLEEGAPVLGGNSICGTFAVKGAHSSRGRECQWNSGSSSPFLGPRAAHSYMTQHSLETDILKESRFVEQAVMSAWGISRNLSNYLSPLRGDELRGGLFLASLPDAW